MMKSPASRAVSTAVIAPSRGEAIAHAQGRTGFWLQSSVLGAPKIDAQMCEAPAYGGLPLDTSGRRTSPLSFFD